MTKACSRQDLLTGEQKLKRMQCASAFLSDFGPNGTYDAHIQSGVTESGIVIFRSPVRNRNGLVGVRRLTSHCRQKWISTEEANVPRVFLADLSYICYFWNKRTECQCIILFRKSIQVAREKFRKNKFKVSRLASVKDHPQHDDTSSRTVAMTRSFRQTTSYV